VDSDDEVVCSYSLLFASRGANVVVNDFNAEAAQKVVDQIVKGTFIMTRMRVELHGPITLTRNLI
jgi:hypothetical protein